MTPEELIGREAEVELLRRFIVDVKSRGVSVLVRGQPGVGKSSLLRAARAIGWDARLSVLEVRGIQSEAMLPFAGLHELLRPLLPRLTSLPPAQRRALLTAFGANHGPPPEPFLIALAALTLIVDAAATRPVLLLIDDVQWLDAPTNDVLAFVSRRLRDDPVIMLCGLRHGHAVALTAAEATEIELQGLDADASRRLLERVAGDLPADDRRALLDQAEGNPLALVELPVVWRSAGADVLVSAAATVPLTTRLEQAFAARITELPALTRVVLLIAAISSEENLAEILAGAAVFCGTAVSTDSLEPAVEARLITFAQLNFRFRHPLVRSAVLQIEPPGRRQAAHAALGEALTSERYRQVWHWAQSVSGPDDAVADLLDASHVECLSRGSVLSAIAALERSAQLSSVASARGRRLLLAAQLAFGLGRADLVNRLVVAAEVTDLVELDRARAQWLRELFSEGTLGDSERVHELCALAVRSAGAGDADLALDLLASAALRCWWAVGEASDRELVSSVAGGLGAIQDDARCVGAIAVANPLGHVPQTRRRLEAMTVAGTSDVGQLRQLGMAARAVGADALAADYFDAAESKLRERGQLGLLSQVLAVQAAVCLDLGAWRRAEQSLHEGRRLAEETNQSTWGTGTAVVEAVFESLTGSTGPALRHAAEIEAACAGEVAGDFLSLVQLARGIAHLSDGRPGEAYEALVPMFDPRQACYHPREQLSAVMFLVEAAVGSGHREDVRGVVDRLETLAETAPSPILGIHLLYARPVLAGDAEAEGLFRVGLAQDLARWPWPRARLELAYGTWLRRRRRLAESRAPLRSALATFDALGAVGWSRQARQGLRAAGDRDHAAPADRGASTLSAQERQIAQLAAAGLSNREIGDQLYLSPRTIGSHLYRIFPKLGITSRSQLAERLGS